MPQVLVVDDLAVDRRLAGSLLSRNPDLRIALAASGAEALLHLEESVPDVIVTDLQMPELNGLELVVAVRQRFPLVPVVLMTAYGSEDVAVRALKAGAASYVPKSRLARDLLRTVESVLATAGAQRRDARLMECLAANHWTFELKNDPALLKALADHLHQHVTRLGLCDETGRIRLTIALEEAMANALYHGNLELSSELRQRDGEVFLAAAEERRRESPYRDRTIHVSATLSRAEAVYVVSDDGHGFDPSLVPDPTDPANLEGTSGRGLLLIRTFMDEVRFNERGNEITMIKRCDPQSPAMSCGRPVAEFAGGPAT
ncbi:MAG TPA: response regulator [Pirellulales bacterium]|nr:response regulator [Pirellulales bacterium]